MATRFPRPEIVRAALMHVMTYSRFTSFCDRHSLPYQRTRSFATSDEISRSGGPYYVVIGAVRALEEDGYELSETGYTYRNQFRDVLGADKETPTSAQQPATTEQEAAPTA